MTQKSKAQLQSDIAADFPTNTTGEITAAVTRSFLTDFTDSVVYGNTAALPIGNVTIDCSLGSLQHIINNGAFTIAAPSTDGQVLLQIINSATPGIVTFAGFTVPTIDAVGVVNNGGNLGDELTVNPGDIFSVFIWRNNGAASYYIQQQTGRNIHTHFSVVYAHGYGQDGSSLIAKTDYPGIGWIDTAAGGHYWQIFTRTGYFSFWDTNTQTNVCTWNQDGHNSYQILPSAAIGWSSHPTDTSQAGMDTGLSRLAAGVVAIGNGIPGNTSGTLQAAVVHLPVITAPASPNDGDIWREDNTNTGFKIRINGITKTIQVV